MPPSIFLCMRHAKVEAIVQLRPCQKGRIALHARHSPGFIYPTIRSVFSHHNAANLCLFCDLLKVAYPYLCSYCLSHCSPLSPALQFIFSVNGYRRHLSSLNGCLCISVHLPLFIEILLNASPAVQNICNLSQLRH